MKHRETHPNLDVEGCFGCRIANVRVAPNHTTTGGERAAQINATEARWQKDMPAYKRLRQDGLQPKGIDGCAEIEKKAETENQVITGMKIK